MPTFPELSVPGTVPLGTPTPGLNTITWGV